MRTFFRITSAHIPAARSVSCLAMILLLSGCHATNGWVMNNSGMGYYQKGNYEMARKEFNRAVIDRPKNPDSRHNLAMALQKQGDLAGAETVLRHNLSVDPMHQPTYHALTQILVSQNRLAEADHLLTGWKETQPYVPEAYVEHAWLQHETGNRVAAEQSLRQALQVKPNHPVALAHLGQLYHESGQADQAAAYYQRSLMARWDQPEVRSRLATLSGSNVRRSAMIQNPTPVMTAAIPVEYGQPIMTQAAMVSSDPIIMQDPVVAERQRRHHHHHNHQHGMASRGSNEQLTAYPLPSYGMADASWQSGMMTASAPLSPAYPQSAGVISDVTIAGQPGPTPMAGPTPMVMTATPQADPAHTTEMTAGLPVVDPY